MADKGFSIENGCLLYNLSLYIPPGERGTYLMVPAELIKTKILQTHAYWLNKLFEKLILLKYTCQ